MKQVTVNATERRVREREDERNRWLLGSQWEIFDKKAPECNGGEKTASVKNEWYTRSWCKQSKHPKQETRDEDCDWQIDQEILSSYDGGSWIPQEFHKNVPGGVQMEKGMNS